MKSYSFCFMLAMHMGDLWGRLKGIFSNTTQSVFNMALFLTDVTKCQDENSYKRQ